MATEMDMDPFEGLRVRPYIAYQNAAVAACKRLGLTAEQLDAGALDEFVESAKEYAKISIQRHYDDMRFAAAGQTYGVELLNKARQRFYKSFRPFTQESSDEKAE